MWSGIIFSCMTLLLIATEEPRNLPYLVAPFLASCLFDLDELLVEQHALEALSNRDSLFGVPAIVVVGVLEVWAKCVHVLRDLLNLLDIGYLNHFLGWLQGAHVIARGAVVHFLLQVCLQIREPLRCAVVLLVFATVFVLFNRYFLCKVHGDQWQYLHTRVCWWMATLNLADAAWLVCATTTGASASLLITINALVPVVVYWPVVVWTVTYAKPSVSVVTIEANPVAAPVVVV